MLLWKLALGSWVSEQGGVESPPYRQAEIKRQTFIFIYQQCISKNYLTTANVTQRLWVLPREIPSGCKQILGGKTESKEPRVCRDIYIIYVCTYLFRHIPTYTHIISKQFHRLFYSRLNAFSHTCDTHKMETIAEHFE